MQKVEIEKQVKLLFQLRENGMSVCRTVRATGQPSGAVQNVKIHAGRIENLVKDCARILDGDLPYLLWPEMLEMKKNGKETESDLRKRIKYLEAKVAYYEELSKLEGVDLNISSKKNATAQSERFSKEESAT